MTATGDTLVRIAGTFVLMLVVIGTGAEEVY